MSACGAAYAALAEACNRPLSTDDERFAESVGSHCDVRLL